MAMLLIADLLSFSPRLSRAAEGLPAVSEVTRRMIERAQSVAREEQAPHYTYEKRWLIERLEGAGDRPKLEEKIYQVTQIAGFPFNRLVKIQGRDLNAEELQEEQRREEKFQQRLGSPDARKLAARKEGWLTAALLDRYEFTLKARVVLCDRPTLMLAFKPRPGKLPVTNIRDKLLNRLEGTVWVDEAEAETAKLSAHLTETVSLGWFGMLGSLSRCDLSLDRQRMPDGVWVNAKQVLFIQCRRIASALQFRSTEESSKFKPTAVADKY